MKVRAWLERQDAEIAWPAASTIGELFDRAGLTVKRRVRRRARRRVRRWPIAVLPTMSGAWISRAGFALAMGAVASR